MARELSSVAQNAKEIRQQLKTAFPGVKFSVKSKNYSGGSSIDVSWTDGPLSKEVSAIANKFESVRYCEYSGEILSGGNSYVFCNRSFSVEVYSQALQKVCKDWGLEVPPIAVSCDHPYIEYSHDVMNVGNGYKRLSELVREELAAMDLYQSPSKSKKSEPAQVEPQTEEVAIAENEEKNGVEITFSGKPSDETKSSLYDNGFRPAKKNGQWYWYAKRNENTLAFAYSLVKKEQQQEVEEVAVVEEEPAIAEEVQESDPHGLSKIEAIAIKPYFVEACFAHMNKQSHIQDYVEEVQKGDFDLDLVEVCYQVKLNVKQWNDLVDGNLLTDYEWLAGKGGTDSSYHPVNDVEEFWQMSEEDQSEWRKHSYRTECILVTCGYLSMVIDPQGYNYARYVGINVHPTNVTKFAA